MAVDTEGSIYVADTENDRVLKFSSTGRVLLDLGRRGRLPGQFHKPSGVAVDAAQNIYVADTQNHRVQVFGSTGVFAYQFDLPPVPPGTGDDDDDASGLGKPFALALDASGNIYVADAKGRRALKFSPSGNLLLTLPILGQPFRYRGQYRRRLPAGFRPQELPDTQVRPPRPSEPGLRRQRPGQG